MPVRIAVLAALCLVVAVGHVSAQDEPARVLHGTVRDSAGGVIVGADVALTGADGRDDRVVTSSSGEFRFDRLPAGRYRLVVSFQGFADAVRTVSTGAQQVTSIDVVLNIAVSEHVEVSAAAGDLESTSLSTTTLTGAALEALPDDPGALLRRIRELAGATDNDGGVTVLVDGFRQELRLPPKQAIQAIRISSNWFAPEFAEPGRARVEIITRAGSSAFHGELGSTFNDESMNARNALTPRRPSGQMQDVTGYLSGPIVAGRWSFMIYGGHWRQRHNPVINAVVVDPDSLEPARYADTVSAPSTTRNLWLGSTYQLGARHTVSFSATGTEERADNQGLDGGLDLPERAYRRTASSHAARLAVISVPTSRVLNEFRGQVDLQRSRMEANSAAPGITVLDAFSGGGNEGTLFVDNRRADVDIADTLTIAGATHTIKLGIEARSTDRRYTDHAYLNGAFVFGADFERDVDGAPLLDPGGGRIPISPLENYRRTLAGLPGYGPSQFSITRGQPDVRVKQRSIAAFIQDDWVATPRLTLSYGVRSAWQTASSGTAVGGRMGFAVALDGERNNVLRLGAGSFHQQIEPELTLDVRRFTGRGHERLLVERPAFFPDVPPVFDDAAHPLPTMYVVTDDLPAPHLFLSAVSYEGKLPAGTFLTMRYGLQRGTGLLRSRNVNAPDDSGARPDQALGPVLQYEPTGRLTRHEITWGLRWTPHRRVSAFANYGYVWSHSDTDGRRTIPADSRRLDLEFGPAAADRPHQANIGANLNVPGGLMVSPYVTLSSGRAFNITTGFDNDGDGVFTDRPAVATAADASAVHTPFGSFVADGPAGERMVARNSGREAMAVRMDLRISRTLWAYRSGVSFMLAANAENLLNRANFEGFNGVVSSPSFGQPTRAAMPRRVSVSARFSF